MTSSRKSGSNTTDALAPRGADDAELELAVGDELDDVLRVGDRERDADTRVARAGTRRAAAGTTVPPGPVDAPSASVPAIALAAPATSSRSCSSSASSRWAPR